MKSQEYLDKLYRGGTTEEMLECQRRKITLPMLREERKGPQEPDPDQLEKDEGKEIDKVYRAHHCIIYNLSQPRKAKYMTPGMPDRLIFRPASGRAWWHEHKRPVGGRYSPAQISFRCYCRLCNVGWVGGDKSVAIQQLRAIGVTVDL